MRLYLSSAGIGDHPERLVELLRGGRRAAVVANALDRSPEFRGEALAEELSGLGRLGLDGRELDLRRDPIEALSEIDLVWVCGGNVFELRRALAASGGDEAIAGLVRADRIVYGGTTAGACVLAPSLHGLETVDEPGDEPRFDGLGLIGFAIVPHCSAPGRPGIPECDRLAERYRADGVPHRALHDGQALVIDDREGRGQAPRTRGLAPIAGPVLGRISRMDVFEVDGIDAMRAAAGELYHEFLRRDSMSVGLYVLRAREADPQTPHNEDELYYVISGHGRIRVGDEDRPVDPGSVIFVAAHVDHRFHSVTSDLTILVVFAPPET